MNWWIRCPVFEYLYSHPCSRACTLREVPSQADLGEDWFIFIGDCHFNHESCGFIVLGSEWEAFANCGGMLLRMKCASAFLMSPGPRGMS